MKPWLDEIALLTSICFVRFRLKILFLTWSDIVQARKMLLWPLVFLLLGWINCFRRMLYFVYLLQFHCFGVIVVQDSRTEFEEFGKLSRRQRFSMADTAMPFSMDNLVEFVRKSSSISVVKPSFDGIHGWKRLFCSSYRDRKGKNKHDHPLNKSHSRITLERA